MREHEVPTHVQAEDRVLLGFTFPQVVAVMAVCALSYGAYRYAPVGPSEVRMALAVLFGLVGVAMTVGKIGGRRLPLVAADLLKYRLGARRYAGQTAQLVRSEPPAPAQPVKTGPGPIRLMVRKARRGLRRQRKKTRQSKERRNGRMRWFGKRRGKDGGKRSQRHDHRAETLEIRRRKPRMGWMAVVAVVLVAAAATVPQAALADDHWRDEIDFEVKEPVPGRRIFVEGLTVSGDRAAVTLRAATALDIRVRAFGGQHGELPPLLGVGVPRRGGAHRLLAPPARTGAVLHRLVGGQPRPGRGADLQARADPVPPARRGGRALRPSHDFPGLDAGRCQRRHRVRLHGRRRGGRRASDGGRTPERRRDGPDGRPGDGSHGDRRRSDRRVPGERLVRPQRRDQLPATGRGGATVHNVNISASLEATLRIAMPPLTQLTHHPARVEQVTKTVHLLRPGDSDSDSDTATVTCDDGATSSATATAYAYVPSATIAKEVTVDVQHKEHVKAETVERQPITRTRAESLTLASAVGSDAPFEVLVLPEPEPEEPPAEQEPANDLRRWFEALGWEWPW